MVNLFKCFSVPSLYEFWEDVHGIKMNTMATTLRKTKSGKPEVAKVEEEHLLAEKVAFCWIDLKEDSLFELDCYSLKHVIGKFSFNSIIHKYRHIKPRLLI